MGLTGTGGHEAAGDNGGDPVEPCGLGVMGRAGSGHPKGRQGVWALLPSPWVLGSVPLRWGS